MSAEERFAVVFEKTKQIEIEEGITVTFEPAQGEAEEIRRLVEIVAEVSRPNYQFVTSA